MVGAALILHGLLLLLVLPARQPAERTAIALQWVELALPEDSAPAPAEMTPPDQERMPEPESATETVVPPPPAAAASTLPPDLDAPLAATPPAPSAQRLRELALIAGRAQTDRTPPPRAALEGSAVPRLPGQSGWLNDHVGTVTPHAERWLEADGASASRVVTASGQVHCGRARAPTAAEEFNPWMSAVVMTWRPCGRERPEPVDRSNPWTRGRGTAHD